MKIWYWHQKGYALIGLWVLETSGMNQKRLKRSKKNPIEFTDMQADNKEKSHFTHMSYISNQRFKWAEQDWLP